MKSTLRNLVCVVAFTALGVVNAAAQAKTVWDGVFTEQQAARGAASFASSCARCHGAEPNGGEEGRRLAGEPFWQSHRESTVDRLLDYVSKSMPNGAPGTLSASTYADLVAFILRQNGLPAGSAELTRDTAVGVKIITKDGPGELPNGTLARVVGCVARKEGGGWVLNRATAPERIQSGEGAGKDDATRPLGDRSITLMYLLTSLESSIGHRMSVRGLLMGDGGKNGINVSTNQSLAPTCQ